MPGSCFSDLGIVAERLYAPLVRQIDDVRVRPCPPAAAGRDHALSSVSIRTATQARALPAATGIAALSSMSRRRIGLNHEPGGNGSERPRRGDQRITARQLLVAVVKYA
jgi:hypothetical protein